MAAELYRKAAEQGDARAQVDLGVAYAKGEGVPKDEKQAVDWYRKAAEQGDAGAQCNLGILCANGIGVPQDGVLVYMLYNLAAAGGNQTAVKMRAELASKLSHQQIEEAQALGANWKPGGPLPVKSRTGAPLLRST